MTSLSLFNRKSLFLVERLIFEKQNKVMIAIYFAVRPYQAMWGYDGCLTFSYRLSRNEKKMFLKAVNSVLMNHFSLLLRLLVCGWQVEETCAHFWNSLGYAVADFLEPSHLSS